MPSSRNAGRRRHPSSSRRSAPSSTRCPAADLDWNALERAAVLAAGSGGVIDGVSLAQLRGRVAACVGEALGEVAFEGALSVEPPAELLVVDRRAWAAGNVRTLRAVIGDAPVSGPEASLVAWEGGAVLGLLARAVLAQFDPFRDVLLVVYPNLGEASSGDALRWLVFHEVTHLGQFRTAPWIADFISEQARSAMRLDDPSWVKEAARRLASSLPDLAAWLRRTMSGASDGTSPLLELLPDEQREIVLRLHGLLTVLEGHATYLTDRISDRLIPQHRDIHARLRAARRRPQWMKLVEALAGLEMKRQQYVQGRAFCEAVWERGGSPALAPFWSGPDAIPTREELRDPDAWLRRTTR